MEHVQIQTAQNVDIEFEVAGIGDRAIAALIDYALLIAYLIGAAILASFVDSTAFWILTALPYLLYFPLCEIFLNGQTIGKRLRSIKVARLDGQQPTLGNYLIRWLIRIVEIDMTTGLVALIAVMVGGKGQRLGDVAAGTTVVRVKQRIHLRDTMLATLDADYTPHFTEFDALTDTDIATAKEVLNTLIAEGRTHIAHRLGEGMKAALELKLDTTTDLSPRDFLRVVIKDYNYAKGRV